MICRLRGEESWESIRFIDRDSIQVPEVWINDAGLFTPSRGEIEQPMCCIPVFDRPDHPLARGELPAAPFNQIVKI
jgi:hypothetical protein